MSDLLKIINADVNLRQYLSGVKNTKITIVTAFAVSTEGVVDELLANGNELNIIVGTINYFSSPAFIDYCAKEKSESISLWVDFRGQQSIHWKLYLIEPDVIIIGSANFTKTGLSLERDTCVIINNNKILNQYHELLKIELNKKDVINSNDARFLTKMSEYKVKHQSMQRAMRNNVVDSNLGFDEWLNDEYHQSMKIFVWEYMHSAKTKALAKSLFDADMLEHTINDEIDTQDVKFRDFFIYQCEEKELPWKQGDIVLCFRKDGTYIGFKKFDRILHHKGLNYMFSYAREDKKYPVLFRLSARAKAKIEEIAPHWYAEDKNELNRDEMLQLLE